MKSIQGVLLTYLLLLNPEDPRWWGPTGAAIALGMMTKYNGETLQRSSKPL